MVASGRITQEQADEYKTWIESRPQGAFESFGEFGKRGFGKHGFHDGLAGTERMKTARPKTPGPFSKSRSTGPLP